MNRTAYTLRRAADRQHSTTDWLDSAHSFSFGHAYDPANTHFGSLLACNEDRLAPGSGYDSHPHRDTEILSWVLEGELSHADSAGRQARLQAGTVQLMSAGAGIEHSERNDGERPLHFVQMWLLPSERGTTPGYRQLDVAPRVATGELVRVAAGDDPTVDELPLRCSGAALWIGRIPAGRSISLPVAEHGFMFVTRGSIELAAEDTLAPGDELRIRGHAPALSAGESGAELLFWQMAADVAQ